MARRMRPSSPGQTWTRATSWGVGPSGNRTCRRSVGRGGIVTAPSETQPIGPAPRGGEAPRAGGGAWALRQPRVPAVRRTGGDSDGAFGDPADRARAGGAEGRRALGVGLA